MNNEKTTSKFSKAKKALKIVGLVLAILLLALFGLSRYGEWKFDQDQKKLAAEINRPYLEDTYGGQTPQETLQLFIDAVEKEDFDLASKYFVLSKQEEWREGLRKIKEKNNLDWLLNNLKNMEERKSYAPNVFQMEARVNENEPPFVIDFVKYPNGNWKIKEI